MREAESKKRVSMPVETVNHSITSSMDICGGWLLWNINTTRMVYALWLWAKKSTKRQRRERCPRLLISNFLWSQNMPKTLLISPIWQGFALTQKQPGFISAEWMISTAEDGSTCFHLWETWESPEHFGAYLQIPERTEGSKFESAMMNWPQANWEFVGVNQLVWSNVLTQRLKSAKIGRVTPSLSFCFLVWGEVSCPQPLGSSSFHQVKEQKIFWFWGVTQMRPAMIIVIWRIFLWFFYQLFDAQLTKHALV